MEYNDSNRGTIQNRDRARQIIDFGGIRYGNITPTDIDGLIEFKAIRTYAIFEFKLKGADLPKGQKLALEEMVNDFEKAGKYACLFVCEHNVEDTNQDIVAAETIVTGMYCDGRWRKPKLKTLEVQCSRWYNYCRKLRVKQAQDELQRKPEGEPHAPD